MNRRRLVAVLGAAVAALAIAGASFASPPRTYITHLTGDAERPTPRDTAAKGVAVFNVAPDGESISYKLVSTTIDNAFMAHIHIGPVEGTGPISVWLFPSTTPGEQGPLGSGRHNGLLAMGTITSADVGGPLAGGGLDALIEAIAAGSAYVNVHTNDGVGDPNTGPGDFPGGEIRGQLP